MEYLYTGITNEPNLATYNASGELVSGIHYDVANSSMTDKGIEYCHWKQETAELKVYFTNELSSGDKTILDGIVADNS